MLKEQENRKPKKARSKLLNLYDRAEKHIIENMEKKRYDEMFRERSQGFWIEDQIRSTLHKITIRELKIRSDILDKSLNEEVFEERVRFRRKTTRISHRKTSTQILPNLRQFMKERQFEQEQDLLSTSKRRKIMHLIIFSLHRYQTERYFESLNIILLASLYFQKNDNFNRLKEITLALIYKVNKNITTPIYKRKSTQKTKTNEKKRNSETLSKYISKEKFMENFMEHLRKSKLVFESSYHSANKGKKDRNHERINAKCDVEIPHPDLIFPKQNIKNYSYIAIVTDDMTNILPYVYPKSLAKHINEPSYRKIICKLNSLLYPESKTYTFESILTIFYTPILFILLALFIFTVVRANVSAENLGCRVIIPCIFVATCFLLGIYINWEKNGYTNLVKVKENMEKYLSQIQLDFKQQNIKFRLADQADAFFIIFPAGDSENSSTSSLTEIVEEQIQFSDSKIEDSVLSKSKTNTCEVDKQDSFPLEIVQSGTDLNPSRINRNLPKRISHFCKQPEERKEQWKGRRHKFVYEHDSEGNKQIDAMVINILKPVVFKSEQDDSFSSQSFEQIEYPGSVDDESQELDFFLFKGNENI